MAPPVVTDDTGPRRLGLAAARFPNAVSGIAQAGAGGSLARFLHGSTPGQTFQCDR
jgi:hypothetical protein